MARHLHERRVSPGFRVGSTQAEHPAGKIGIGSIDRIPRFERTDIRERMTTMLKTFTAALLAATLIAAPVFAAGATATTTATPAVTAPVKADAKAGLNAKAAAPAPAVATPAKADIKANLSVKKGKSFKKARVHVVKAKHVRHLRTMKPAKHTKHIKITHKISHKAMLGKTPSKSRS
jgi:hypothetical protein